MAARWVQAAAPWRPLIARLHAWLDRRGPYGTTIKLRYRHIYILPTRGGLLFAVTLLVIWIGAVNYDNALAFLLCFLLAGLGVVAMIHTFRNLVELRLSAVTPAPVFAREPPQIPVRVHNHTGRTREGMVLRCDGTESACPLLEPATATTVTLTLAARSRGEHSLPPATVETRFPGGLFRAWSRVRLETRLLVYPQPEPGDVPPPEHPEGASRGPRSARGGDDFAGLRRYQPGDSLRHVAWRTLAQDQELQTKQFAAEASGTLRLRYRELAHLAPEQRLARLCRWVLDAEAAQRQYGLELPGTTVPPAKGPVHRDQCLAALARFNA